MNGRFDLIVLHACAGAGALARRTPCAQAGQALFDLFCRDMDDNLREIGIGDIGCAQAYAAASARRSMAGPQAYRGGACRGGRSRRSTKPLARNVYAASRRKLQRRDLPPMCAGWRRDLERQACEAMRGGTVSFPDPRDCSLNEPGRNRAIEWISNEAPVRGPRWSARRGAGGGTSSGT